METLNVLQPLIHGDGTSACEWQHSSKLHDVQFIGVQGLVRDARRVVIVAAHPDDEILGCGMLLAELAQSLDLEVVVIAASDGEASHPASKIWTREILKRVRPTESQAALRDMEARATLHRLHLPDGGLSSLEGALASQIREIVTSGDLLIGHWRHDGHPDHEAVGRACARIARSNMCRFVEYPVWAWHWADPQSDDLPWQRARRLAASDASRERKNMAMTRFTSQIIHDESTGERPVVSQSVLQRAEVVGEVFLI